MENGGDAPACEVVLAAARIAAPGARQRRASTPPSSGRSCSPPTLACARGGTSTSAADAAMPLTHASDGAVTAADTHTVPVAELVHLHAHIERLQAMVNAQQATIEELRSRERKRQGFTAAAAAPHAAATALAVADRHPLPLDAVLANWCESGTASYLEFLRVAETCTSWRRRVLHQLRLSRSLELCCELNLPPVRTDEGQRRYEWKSLYQQGYAKYLAAVTKALDRMGANLQALHLRRQACFACSVSQESSREVVVRLNALAQKHSTLRLSSLSWSLGFVSLAGLSKRILHTLHELDVADNQLGDEGCKVLVYTLLGHRGALGGAAGGWCSGGAEDGMLAGPLTNLTKLNVSNNGIREPGFCYLVTALRRLPSLERLNVSGNSPGRAGCAALGSLISSSPRLLTLGLQHCNICRNVTSHDFSGL